jgi:hypothetical protein
VSFPISSGLSCKMIVSLFYKGKIRSKGCPLPSGSTAKSDGAQASLPLPRTRRRPCLSSLALAPPPPASPPRRRRPCPSSLAPPRHHPLPPPIRRRTAAQARRPSSPALRRPGSLQPPARRPFYSSSSRSTLLAKSSHQCRSCKKK